MPSRTQVYLVGFIGDGEQCWIGISEYGFCSGQSHWRREQIFFLKTLGAVIKAATMVLGLVTTV